MAELTARLILQLRRSPEGIKSLISLLGDKTQALLPELLAFQPAIYGWFEEADRRNLSLAVAAVAADAMNLVAVPETLRDDVVERLLTTTTLCDDDYETLLSLLPPDKITPGLAAAAVRSSGRLYANLPETHKSNLALAVAANHSEPKMYEWLPEALRDVFPVPEMEGETEDIADDASEHDADEQLEDDLEEVPEDMPEVPEQDDEHRVKRQRV